jgi:chemotaxis regulatin CheY-phosphate phosphatase CheZ
MAAKNRPEIFLEMNTGFFRIPTSDANFNVTVLGSGGETIPSVQPVSAESPSVQQSFAPLSEESEFYEEVSNELYNDIGQLAKSLSDTIKDIPAEDRLQKRVELDEADEKIEDAKSQLQDIVKMTEKAAMEIMDNVEKVQGETNEVRDLLSTLKEHPAFATGDAETTEPEEETEENSSHSEESLKIKEFMSRAKEILAAVQADGEVKEAPEPAKKTETKTLYIFDVDVVFQTLYELCTNETVKDHIKAAREKAEEIFHFDTFYHAIAPKAAAYEADGDNFFNVPMSDVFTSLLASCNDKKISNLLKKMDKGQSEIFLDQTIPLEAPPTKEVEVEVEGGDEGPAEESPSSADPRLAEVQEILQQGLDAVDPLCEKSSAKVVGENGAGVLSLSEKEQIFEKIEEALGKTSKISADVSGITETLSFQDLSGQQIMKIIKMLSDFQIQLLAIIVSFGSRLKRKKEDASLSVEESKELAQSDVDSYISKLTVDKTADDQTMLDQNTVNNMLEEMGF